MSIRPRLGVEVPELTARVARASNPAGTTAMWVRDRLDGLREDGDFAGWYPRDGRPGVSPAQLATVSVLQFLLDLSDCDAAEAVRCRIDFKYALGLDLDDPGFHHSVLGDFRDRLLEEGGRTGSLTWHGPGVKEAGLVRERTAWRTDSTHVLAAVRDLTRLELVTEAIRAALEELARTAGHALDGLVDDDWGRRYGLPVRLGKNPARPKTRMNEAGADARRLTGHLAARCPDLLRGPRVEALRQILVQTCHWDPAGRLRWRDDEGDAGLPPSAARIVSPCDLAAPLLPPGPGHPLDGIPRPRDRDLRRRRAQRHHRRRHHARRQRRQAGPGRHPHPAGAPGPAPRRASRRRRLHLPRPHGKSSRDLPSPGTGTTDRGIVSHHRCHHRLPHPDRIRPLTWSAQLDAPLASAPFPELPGSEGEHGGGRRPVVPAGARISAEIRQRRQVIAEDRRLLGEPVPAELRACRHRSHRRT